MPGDFGLGKMFFEEHTDTKNTLYDFVQHQRNRYLFSFKNRTINGNIHGFWGLSIHDKLKLSANFSLCFRLKVRSQITKIDFKTKETAVKIRQIENCLPYDKSEFLFGLRDI